MDCTKYTELMSAALDGECTAEEHRELDRHLAVCPECAALFEILSANAKAAREMDCEMPAGLKERILNNLPEQEQPKKQGKVIHWKRWIPVAAAACLVLVVSLVPRFGMGGMGTAENAAPGAAEPASSSVIDSAKAGVADHSYGYYDPAAPGECAPAGEPAPSAEPAPDVSEEPMPPAEPEHYWFDQQNVLRLSYNESLKTEARIVGSVEELWEYLFTLCSTDSVRDYLRRHSYLDDMRAFLAQLEASDIQTSDDALIPELLSGLLLEYDSEEFFETNRLLCVTVVSDSTSNRYELAPQGLYRDSVTVMEDCPENGAAQKDAWMFIAQVDTMFDPGDTLEVNFAQVDKNTCAIQNVRIIGKGYYSVVDSEATIIRSTESLQDYLTARYQSNEDVLSLYTKDFFTNYDLIAIASGEPVTSLHQVPYSVTNESVVLLHNSVPCGNTAPSYWLTLIEVNKVSASNDTLELVMVEDRTSLRPSMYADFYWPEPIPEEYYSFYNEQIIRIEYSKDLHGGAQVIGSVESLINYLSNFVGYEQDSKSSLSPAEMLTNLKRTYTAEFFQDQRLLLAVVWARNDSYPFTIDPEGLHRQSIYFYRNEPSISSKERSAWLVIVEVDNTFNDGDRLAIIYSA